MQNALRKWLVGFGLVAALLALAVPALAQNQWLAQTNPAGTFPTPVTAMNVGPLNQVEAVTAGGGYPGGVLGSTYYDNAGGTNFTMRSGAGQPPANPTGEDYTSVAWDGTWWFAGGWNTGLWDFNGAIFTNPTATAPLWVNKHVECFAVDVDNTTGAYPHVLYIGSWGDGMYSFDGTTWTKLAGYPGAAPAQFIRKVMLVSNGAGNHPDVYTATDGYGVVKGVWTGATWSWSQVYTGDLFITSLCNEGGADLFAGTKALGILESSDNGVTWGSEASVPVITTPVTAIINTAVGLFAGTAGQGIYRKDEISETWYRIDTAGCAGGATVDPYINDLAFETAAGPVYTLFAGAGQQVAGGVGHVYSITLANPTAAAVPPQTPVVGTPYTLTLPITAAAVCSPKNWTYNVSGTLPPGLGVVLNNTPTPPTVTITGTPTVDCSYNVTIRVWDSLFNYVDVPVSFLVQLMAPTIYVNTTPTPLGSVMAFSTDSPATLGAQGTVSYIWNFGDGAPFPAADSTVSNPTHIYTAPGPYTVTLWVSDSACPGGAAACPAVSPDNCNTLGVAVYGPLTVDPNATIVGSGSQFQFNPNVLGGLPNCAMPPSPDGYTYQWYFYLGQAPVPSNTPPPGWIASSTDSNPIETFTSTGNFWAWLHVSDCSGHDAYGYCVVNYNGPMSVTFASNTNPAPTGYPVVFQATALGDGLIANYLADCNYGDGNFLLGQSPSLPTTPAFWGMFTETYATAGDYTVTFTAKDDPAPPGGHTTIVTYKQQIYDAFTGITVVQTTGNCQAGYPSGPVPKQMCFDVTPVGGLPPYMLSVDWGDGSTTMLTGITAGTHNYCHTYTAAGAYTPVFYMTDSGNYSVTNSQAFGPFFLGNALAGHISPACQSVLQPAAASITVWNDTVLSAGFASGDFWYLVYWGDGANTGWNWFAAPSQVLNHNYPVLSGVQTYTPTYYIYNWRNCQQIGPISGATINVYNALNPLAAPAWTQACGSRTVSFTATAPTTGVAPYTYKWDFGDGTLPYTTAGPTTTHTFAANGNYNCQLTVNDSAHTLCGVPADQTRNVIYLVQVVEPISGTIAGPSGNIGCAVATEHYTSAMAGGALIAPVPPFQPNAALNYTWSVSPSGGVVIASPNSWETDITFNNPGTYTISLSVSSIAVPGYICSASNTISVTVIGGINLAAPITFNVTETSGYLPLPDTFTSTYSVTDPSADVTVTYTFLKNGVAYMFPTTDPVYTQPGVFTAPNIYTIHPSTTFMNTTFNFVEAGTYTVTMVVSDSCGNSNAPGLVKVIQILEPQALSVTTAATPGAGNAPLTVSFASSPTGGVPDSSSQYLYDWNFGDGSAHSTAQNPTHVYTAGAGSGPWTYTASVTVKDFYPVPNPPDARHTATASVNITVYAGMTVVASATTPTSGSKPLSVTFNAATTGGNGTYTYFWYFGDGATSTLQNPSHSYGTAGTYFAYVVVNDTASHTATSNQVVINVYDPLVITANASPSAGIIPLAVAFSAAANGGDNNYTYTWDFGDGSATASGALVNHTYTVAGPTGTTYNVNVHVVDGVGHSADKALTVKAYRPLTASIASNVTSGFTPLAVNFTSTVAGGDGAYTYLWNFGDGTTGNTANPAKTYTTAGNYSVTLTVTDGASHVIISNTIDMTTWSPMSVASSATPTNIIVGQSITFTALAQGGTGIYTYTWTFGDSTTGTGATTNHMYAVGPSPSFTYTAHVSVSDTAGHTVTGANIVVTVKPVPPTILGAEKLVPPQVESWRLRLVGTNFQSGCVATINGTAVTTTYKNSGQVILKNCKSLCPKNTPVIIVVTNPDGGVSANFTYVRTEMP